MPLACLLLALVAATGNGMTIDERRELREEVRALFTHGYDNYMAHAFPRDVLKPLSCRGEDGWGSVTLTLLDTLDTLALMGNATEFECACAPTASNTYSLTHTPGLCVSARRLRH